ncbi:MAG: uridine kinase [Streptosporangiales bacterium]|nr:uridine kinase [Streptosporangiales bacterium]
MELADRLASAATTLSRSQDRVLICVDGPDATGKTTLANHLAETLEVPVQRASIDGFHQPREVRYQRGELSGEGYYRDSFDYPALLGTCLTPFREGAARVQIAKYDYRADTHDAVYAVVPPRAVLIFDGVFLLREQLRDLWTFSVYLCVSPEATLRRAHARDLDLFQSGEEIERRYLRRYLPGQALYRAEADPEAAAHVVVDNERVHAPTIKRWTVPASGNPSGKR